MAFPFRKGDTVRQKMPAPIVGTVDDYEIDRTTGDVLAKVVWSDADGEHSRFFTEVELEAATE